LILDASVLFESLIESVLGDAARSLVISEPSLRAPDLIEVEIAGAITKAVRRKDIEARLAPALFAHARRVMPDVDPSAPLVQRAFALSLALNHPLADCIFLAHAEARGDRRVTADQRFVSKLMGTAHERHAAYLGDWNP
jgi:predicted nucleic acid-binding protein